MSLIRWARQRVTGAATDDRGAVAPLVGVLAASGVLLAFLALVVDVGQLYLERQELRSGADSAALAVGKACALDLAQCASVEDLAGLAQIYADANSADGVSAVNQVCGRLPGLLVACPPPVGNLTDCVGEPPAEGTPYVEVHLSTELPDGTFVLPPAFAQAMIDGFEGANVAVCARVTWQQPSQWAVLAMTISTCEFGDATADAAGFAPAPPYPPDPQPALEYTIEFLDGPHGGCGVAPELWYEAGPAAQLLGDQNCEVLLPPDGVMAGSYLWALPPSRPPDSCIDRLRDAVHNREVIYLPVHDGVSGQSINNFRTVYLAPFVATGFSFGSDQSAGVDLDEPSWLRSPPAPPCGGVTHRCVSGLFVGPPVPLTSIADDAVVRLIG